MNENMEFPGASPEDIEWLQDQFIKTIQQQIENSKEDRKVAKEDKGKVNAGLILSCRALHSVDFPCRKFASKLAKG